MPNRDRDAKIASMICSKGLDGMARVDHPCPDTRSDRSSRSEDSVGLQFSETLPNLAQRETADLTFGCGLNTL